MIDDNQLKKLNRVELLELLVEQGEQLERTQQALVLAEARAAHQERIARLAEDAAARLSGILEAAQLAQAQYNQNLRELKAQMGITSETVSTDDGSAGASYAASSSSYPSYYDSTANSGYSAGTTGYSYGTDGSYYNGYSYPAGSTSADGVDYSSYGNGYPYQGGTADTSYNAGGDPV